MEPHRARAYRQLTRTVQALSNPGECLLVFPYDAMFNFFTRRDNCISFCGVHQEVLSADRVREINRVIVSGESPVVVLKDYRMPMKNSLSGGLAMRSLFPSIYEPLEKNYVVVAQPLYWKVLLRKTELHRLKRLKQHGRQRN